MRWNNQKGACLPSNCLLARAAMTMLVSFALGASAFADLSTKRPKFRELMTGTVYNVHTRQIIRNLASVEELEQSQLPPRGLEILEVVSGSQADKLAITEGDVITHLDDKPLDVTLPPRNKIASLRLVTSKGEQREVDVAPGMVGVRYIPYNRLDLHYIQAGQRSPKFENDVRTAIATCRTDPALAESAMYRAISQGYEPDVISDTVGALASLAQGRPDRAQRFVEQLPPVGDDGAAYNVAPADRYRIALANGDIDRLSQLLAVEGAPGINRETVVRMRKWVQNRSQPRPAPERPLSDGMRRRDVMPDLRASTDKRVIPPGHLNLFAPLEKTSFDINAWPGRPYQYVAELERPVQDFEMVVRGRVSAEPRSLQWANILKIEVKDLAAEIIDAATIERLNRMTLLGAGFERNELGRTVIHLGGAFAPRWFTYDDPAIDLAAPFEFEVRLIRVEGWGQVILNDAPVSLLPLERNDDEQLALYLQVVGADAEIDAIELWALEAE